MSESEGGSLTIIIAGNRISRFYRRGGGARGARGGGARRSEAGPNFVRRISVRARYLAGGAAFIRLGELVQYESHVTLDSLYEIPRYHK